MILMALDHVRDFFHAGAMSFSPTDLDRTTPALFFTRWITHFCLPVFMFTAGMGTFLWWQRSKRASAQLSRFLWTRGTWFILLEFTVMRFAYNGCANLCADPLASYVKRGSHRTSQLPGPLSSVAVWFRGLGLEFNS